MDVEFEREERLRTNRLTTELYPISVGIVHNRRVYSMLILLAGVCLLSDPTPSYRR